ncbi:MAG TPA: SLC13 family permease, partial [Gillisia sp.]|nr:SLC13 family permease [Gillisia sp.]
LITILIVSLLYKLLPNKRKVDITKDYNLDEYITKVIINKDSDVIGKKIFDTFFHDNMDVEILRLKRDAIINDRPGKYTILKAKDQLLLRCNLENLVKLKEDKGFSVIKDEGKKFTLPITEAEGLEENIQVVEILMLPNSPLIGKSIKSVGNFDLQGAVPLAIKKRSSYMHPGDRVFGKKRDEIELRVGDRLLVEVSAKALSDLGKLDNITILQQYQEIEVKKKSKRIVSLGILLVVVSLSAFSIFPILQSALVGVFLMIFLKCLDLGKAYSQINWQVIFLLAGMIPLGIAMSNSGADMWIADHLLALFTEQSSTIIIGILFLVTMILSGFVSNNATAIIITPIAITIAASMKLDPKPFIMAIMFAANFSFFTPVGYQTNTLIYGMGIYKFRHFLIVGGSVSLVLWIVGSLLLSGTFTT